MPPINSPSELVSRADLKSAVYAVFHVVMAGSLFITAAVLSSLLLAFCAALFAGVAVLNASLIDRCR